MDIKLNKLDRDFIVCWNKLKEKYGEEFEKINGLHNENLNLNGFIDNFIDSDNVANATIDSNANSSIKDVRSLIDEINKPHMKLLSYNKIFHEAKKKYGLEVAQNWFELDWSGALYLHDAPSSSFYSYCYAYELADLVEKGLFFLPKTNTSPAKHLNTFAAHLREFIVWVSNRTSGACALPSFFIYSYYFWKKDVEDGYYIKDPEYYRKQFFQQFIYEINQIHTRITQSAFTNVIIMDRNYITEIFGDRQFPDGSYVIDQIEEIIEHQKVFMKTVSKIRNEIFLTFPVITFSLLFQDGKFVDDEFARWCNKHNMEWYDSNFYIGDTVTNLASCCLDGDEKVLIKSSDGVSFDTIKNICDAPYKENKRNFTVFHNGSWVGAKPIRLPSKQLYKITTANNKSITVTSDHFIPTINGDKFAKELTTDDYIAFSNRQLDAFPEKDKHLTYEQGFVIGLYAGDGSTYCPKNENWSNRVTYSLNDTNVEDIEKIKTALVQMHINNAVTVSKAKNVLRVDITSQVLYDFIKEYISGNYAYDKKFNLSCLLQSADFRRGIIDGWYASDGGNSNRIYSVSTDLIETGEVIFTSLGMNTVISVDDRTGETRFIDGDKSYSCTCPLHCIRWYDMKNKRSMSNIYKTINNTEYFKVTNIDLIENKYNTVYCFEMKNYDEPYFTMPNGMITHNCRMVNDTSKMEKQFQSSIGGSLVEIGSVKVSTINLMRIAIESNGNEDKFIEILTDRVDLNIKILDVIRDIIQRNIEKGLLPNYTNEIIKLNKQTVTNGLTAMFETIEEMNMTEKDKLDNIYYTNKGIEFASKIMDTVNTIQDNSNRGYGISLEIIPAESANVKLCKKDNLLYGRDNAFIYSNQWVGMMEKCTLQEKIHLASILDKKAGGGQILHVGLEGKFSNEEQSWNMLNYIAKNGVIYFAYNPRLSLCKNNHVFFGNICPNCGCEKSDEASRIVGYLVPTSAYSKERKKEFENRRWYPLSDDINVS